jgi:hypothetical protein
VFELPYPDVVPESDVVEPAPELFMPEPEPFMPDPELFMPEPELVVDVADLSAVPALLPVALVVLLVVVPLAVPGLPAVLLPAALPFWATATVAPKAAAAAAPTRNSCFFMRFLLCRVVRRQLQRTRGVPAKLIANKKGKNPTNLS